MVIEIESIMSMTCWNYLGKTPNVFEVNDRQSEGAMKNGQSRETGNKTQDEDKQSKYTTQYWTPPCTRWRQKKTLICVGHHHAQDVDKLTNSKKKAPKNPIYVGHHNSLCASKHK